MAWLMAFSREGLLEAPLQAPPEGGRGAGVLERSCLALPCSRLLQAGLAAAQTEARTAAVRPAGC